MAKKTNKYAQSGLFAVAGIAIGYLIANSINQQKIDAIQKEILRIKAQGGNASSLEQLLQIAESAPSIFTSFKNLFSKNNGS